MLLIRDTVQIKMGRTKKEFTADLGGVVDHSVVGMMGMPTALYL